MIRPKGVVSKNDMGACMTRLIEDWEENEHPYT